LICPCHACRCEPAERPSVSKRRRSREIRFAGSGLPGEAGRSMHGFVHLRAGCGAVASRSSAAIGDCRSKGNIAITADCRLRFFWLDGDWRFCGVRSAISLARSNADATWCGTRFLRFSALWYDVWQLAALRCLPELELAANGDGRNVCCGRMAGERRRAGAG